MGRKPKVQKQYKARRNSRISNREAQVIGSRLDEITRKLKGELTPQAVIEDAKKVSSPLHKHFEWDDSIAGEKFRMYQARKLMGEIYEVVVTNSTKNEFRSFVHVTNTDGKPVYVTVDTAFKQKNYTVQLIEDAQEDIARLSKTLNILIGRLKI